MTQETELQQAPNLLSKLEWFARAVAAGNSKDEAEAFGFFHNLKSKADLLDEAVKLLKRLDNSGCFGFGIEDFLTKAESVGSK